MSSQPSRLMAPLSAYREPPAGLSLEWDRTYMALADTVTAVAGIDPDRACRATRELLEALHERIRKSEDAASAVLQFLRPRSPRTWRAGQAILSAVSPITSAFCVAIRFMKCPHPTTNGTEATTASLKARIADQLSSFDAVPLLDELAAAALSDCQMQRGQQPPALTGGTGSATGPNANREPGKKNVKGKGGEAKMLKKLSDDPTSCEWTAERWGEALGVRASTVKGYKTWKNVVMASRAVAAAQRASRDRALDGTRAGRR